MIHHVEEVSGNVSLLRHQPAGVFRLPETLRGQRRGVPPGPSQRSSLFTERDRGGGRGQDPLTAVVKPFRAAEDRDVFVALPRPHHQLPRGSADPPQGRSGPAAGIAALRTQRHHMQEIRETTPRPRPPGRDVKFIEPVGQTAKKSRYYQYNEPSRVFMPPFCWQRRRLVRRYSERSSCVRIPRTDVAEEAVESFVVVPVDPVEGGFFDIGQASGDDLRPLDGCHRRRHVEILGSLVQAALDPGTRGSWSHAYPEPLT